MKRISLGEFETYIHKRGFHKYVFKLESQEWYNDDPAIGGVVFSSVMVTFCPDIIDFASPDGFMTLDGVREILVEEIGKCARFEFTCELDRVKRYVIVAR